MDKSGYVLLRKSDRRTGSICLKVSGEADPQALNANLIDLIYLLKNDYPVEITKALVCNLKHTLRWYQNQNKEGLLVPTRPRLILPAVIQGFKQERYLKLT